jgi:hypothetical protein
MTAAAGAEARAVVAAELERVVRRWHQLPLDHALSAVPQVRALVQDVADEVAAVEGLPRQDVPDLGPAVLLDQLRVMVHDHARVGLADDARSVAVLAARLTDLRRTLP